MTDRRTVRFPRALTDVDQDDAQDESHNCPQCLHRLEAVDGKSGPFWRCPECGFTRL